MSITTKRGDAGETDLLFGRRVSKTDLRMAALGATDELTASLGLVRIHVKDETIISLIDGIQRALISVMGILATKIDDYPRYLKDGFSTLEDTQLDHLTAMASELEKQLPSMKDWVLPGSRNNAASAFLDMSRTVCRRAERNVIELAEAETLPPVQLLPYLNRLSDLLWLMARKEEISTPPSSV